MVSEWDTYSQKMSPSPTDLMDAAFLHENSRNPWQFTHSMNVGTRTSTGDSKATEHSKRHSVGVVFCRISQSTGSWTRSNVFILTCPEREVSIRTMDASSCMNQNHYTLYLPHRHWISTNFGKLLYQLSTFQPSWFSVEKMVGLPTQRRQKAVYVYLDPRRPSSV